MPCSGAAAVLPTAADSDVASIHSSPRHHLHLQAHSEQSPQRAAVQNYIAHAFAQQYGARVDHFLPLLLTLEQETTLRAAVGLRRANQGSLFVEHYLDHPIEWELRDRGFAIQRERVVEIGNLVSTRPGGSQLLFILIAGLIEALGSEMVVFTATPVVSALLERLGCRLTVLCRADGQRMGVNRQQWGSYYDSNPSVVAIEVQSTLPHLRAQPRIAQALAAYTADIARIRAGV